MTNAPSPAAAAAPSGWQLPDLPFFEPRHQELALRIAKWIAANLVDAHLPEDLTERSRQVLHMLGDAGWLAFVVPQAGAQIDVRAVCLIREALSYHDMLADDMFIMQGIGMAAIARHGSPAQRERYLDRARAGTAMAALALTEKQSGSDVANMDSSARRDGDGYILTGEKAFISNAGMADHYVVAARTGQGAGAKGLSLFIVDADNPGLHTGPAMQMIADHPIADMSLKDCRVRADAMIGAPGEGFRAAMATLNMFRPTVGASAVGIARRALAETLDRVHRRRMFGGAMGALSAVQSQLADMACDLDAAALLVYRAAWGQDKGRGAAAYEASMAKLAATEAAGRVVDRAVQLFGGMGVLRGSVVERLYREVRPMRIYEGASEVQKLVIGRDLLKRSAPASALV